MKTLSQTFYFLTTAFAIVYALTTFLLTSAILWWSENGEIVKTKIVQFILLTLDAVGATYYNGIAFRMWCNNTMRKTQDFLYYQSLAIYC